MAPKEAALEALGALPLDAYDAPAGALELRERREQAGKRLQAMSAGVELGVEVRNALAAVQGSLATVLAGMERERLRALVPLAVMLCHCDNCLLNKKAQGYDQRAFAKHT